MQGFIHPTAIIMEGARIGQGVQIGAYSLVEAGAVIGDACVLKNQAVVRSGSILGDNVVVDSFAVIGGDPQIGGFDSSIVSGVQIGAGTVIREGVTVHRSSQAGGFTTVGSNCMLMGNCHLGHDCTLANNIIIANGVLLAGHVSIDSFCFLGGAAILHQFLRVGEGAMIGGGARLTFDIPPYIMVTERNELSGLNLIGLKRREFSRDSIMELKECFRAIYSAPGNVYEKAAAAKNEGLGTSELAKTFLTFFENRSKKGILPYRNTE